MTILQIIQTITQKKKQSKIVPDHVTDKEIMQFINDQNLEISRERMRSELNKLVKEMKVVWGHTINNLYFKFNNHEEV